MWILLVFWRSPNSSASTLQSHWNFIQFSSFRTIKWTIYCFLLFFPFSLLLCVMQNHKWYLFIYIQFMLLRHRHCVCTWSAKRPTNGSLQVVTNVGYAADKLRNRFVLSVLRRRCYIAHLCRSSCERVCVCVCRFVVADGCIRVSASSCRMHVYVCGVEPIKQRETPDNEIYESERENLQRARRTMGMYCVQHGRCCAQNRILISIQNWRRGNVSASGNR